MFTGLVEACVAARSLERSGAGARLVLPLPEAPGEPGGWRVALGESVSVSGVCLTVAARDAGTMAFDLSAETLERSWLGELAPGRGVNLERSLRLGDRLGGHLVAGHVDARGRIAAIEDARDGGARFTFEVPAGFERWLVDKGSVAVDGVSLTVVEPRGRRFDVAVIPQTLELTSLGTAEPGEPVNLEGDLIGKWVARLFPGARPEQP